MKTLQTLKAALLWRRLFSTSLFALGAAMTMCTPFKEDPLGDSGSVDSSPRAAGDAGTLKAMATMADGSADAGPPCDLSKPFGPPTFVQGLANTGAISVGDLRLSPDSLTGYFHANYSASGNGADLFTATRSGPGAPFEHIAPLGDGTVNTLDNEASPAVSGDGLTLVFVRLSRQVYRIHYATRRSTLVPFTYVGPVSPNDPGTHYGGSFLREDGKVLYFVSSAVSPGGNWDIYRAAWDGSSLGPALPVPELNTAFGEYGPVVTPNDLTIYFGSSRPPANAQAPDIWMATRASTKDPFSAPMNVTELNSTENRGPTFIARGGCALYFQTLGISTLTTNPESQYVAEKPPR